MYFGVLMIATLWLSGIFGDDRITVGATLIVVWGLSWLIRRRQRPAKEPEPLARPRPSATTLQPVLVGARSSLGEPISEGEATSARATAARQAATLTRSKKPRRKQRH
jgi:hypothetical protein